jgi:hypothetical protein
MTLLSHSMTFPILSPHKFGDVVGTLMHLPLRLAYKLPSLYKDDTIAVGHIG